MVDDRYRRRIFSKTNIKDSEIKFVIFNEL